MSLKLKYKVTEASFRPEIADSVRRVYGVDISKGHIYRVLASFKSKDFWIGPLPMIYDTGAAVSLLPFRFFEILNVEGSAPIKLSGVVSEMKIPARLTRLT